MTSKKDMSGIQRFADCWLIGRSKKHNGQIYYFNTATGDAVWNLSDAEIEKAKNATKKLQAVEASQLVDTYPEPKEEPPMQNPQNDRQGVMPSTSTSRETTTQIINNRFIQPFTPFNTILCSPCIEYANNPVGLNIAPAYNPNIWAVPPQQLFLTRQPMINQMENSVNNNFEQSGLGNNIQRENLSNRFTNLNRGNYPDRQNFDVKYQPQQRFRQSQQYRLKRYQNLPNNDLRQVLTAKRRKSQSEPPMHMEVDEPIPDQQEMVREETDYQTEEINDIPCNNINLDRPYDTRLESDLTDSSVSKFALDVAPLKNLASNNSDKEKWYLVADTDIYLNHFDYLNILFNSDPDCHLMVPPIIVEELEAAKGQNSKVLNWARLASSFLEKQIKAGYAVIDKDVISNVKNLQMLRSCKSLVDENYHVVLISNDITLKSYHLQKTFPIFTMAEVKEFLQNCANRPDPSIDRIKIVVPNDRHTAATGKAISNPSQPDSDTSVEVNKDKTQTKQQLENERRSASRTNSTTDACSQTDSISMTTITEDNVDNNKDEQEKCHSNPGVLPTPNLGRKIRLKRKTSNEPVTATNEKKGFKWRRRRDGTNPSNDNATSTNIPPDTEKSNIDNQTETSLHCDTETNTVNENSESGSVVHNTNTSEDKILVEETSTSGIISNSESYVDSELNFSWLRSNIQPSRNTSNASMFEVTDNTMAEYLSMKCDEWVSRFVQIMEEVLTQILQLDPPFVHKNLPPPWTIHEATECVKKKFEKCVDVFSAANKLSKSLFDVSEKTGRIRRSLKPSEYMEMYSYGVHLISRLQIVYSNSEDLQTAMEALSNILRDIQDPHMGAGNNDTFTDIAPEISLNMSAANYSMMQNEETEETREQSIEPITEKYDLRSRRSLTAQELNLTRQPSTSKPSPKQKSRSVPTSPILPSPITSPILTTPLKNISPSRKSTPTNETPLSRNSSPMNSTPTNKSRSSNKATPSRSNTPVKTNTKTISTLEKSSTPPNTPPNPVVQFVRNIDIADAFFQSLQLQKSDNLHQSVLNSKNTLKDNPQISHGCVDSAEMLDEKPNDNSFENIAGGISEPEVLIVRKFTMNNFYEEKLKQNDLNNAINPYASELDYDEEIDECNDEYDEDKDFIDPIDQEFVEDNIGVVQNFGEEQVDSFYNEIMFPNVDNVRTISDTNNNNARLVINAIVNEVKVTLSKSYEFCEKAKLFLKENGLATKHKIKAKTELVQTNLQSLCKSLKSSLAEETFAPNRFRGLMFSCGFDINDIDETESAAYRTVITKCHDQAKILLEVVNVLAESIK